MGPAASGNRPGVVPRLGTRRAVFAFPPAIRKIIYTTNAVDSLHCSLRKIIKTRGSFEAALKLLSRAIRKCWGSLAPPH